MIDTAVQSSHQDSVFGKILRALLAVLMVWIILSRLFSIGGSFSLTLFGVTAAGLLLAAGTVFLCARFPANRPKTVRVILGLLLMTLILGITDVILTKNLRFLTGWDAGTVREASIQAVWDDNVDWEPDTNIHDAGTDYGAYFAQHPNNITLTAFFTVIRQLFHDADWENVEEFLAILSMLNIPLSAFLTGLMGWKLTHTRRGAYGAFLLIAVLFGFNPWFTIPYSDPYAMSFTLLILFFPVMLSGTRVPSLLRLIPVVFFAALGYLIKPTVLIAVIALVLVQLFTIREHIPQHRDLPKLLLRTAAAAVCVALALASSSAVRSWGTDLIYADENPDKVYGMVHYLALGLNPDTMGTYSAEDDAATSAADDREEQNEICWNTFKSRAEAFGPLGIIAFEQKKLLSQWSDGSFGWTDTDDWYFAEIPVTDDEATAESLRDVFWPDGSSYPVVNAVFQLLWSFILGCAALGAVICIHNPPADNHERHSYETLALSVIGIALFIILFENSGRYLTAYVPSLVLAALIGIRQTAGIRIK